VENATVGLFCETKMRLEEQIKTAKIEIAQLESKLCTERAEAEFNRVGSEQQKSSCDQELLEVRKILPSITDLIGGTSNSLLESFQRSSRDCLGRMESLERHIILAKDRQTIQKQVAVQISEMEQQCRPRLLPHDG
jgi:hypothetical protein